MAEKKDWRDYLGGKSSDSGSSSNNETSSGNWRDYMGDESSNSGTTSGGWRDYYNPASIVVNNATNRVNKWLRRNNSYLSSYNKRYENRKYTHEDAYVSDSASWLDTATKRADELEAERQEILDYINQNKKYLDPEWVKSVEDALAGESKKHKGIIESATMDNDYWLKFTPNKEQTAAGYTAEKLYSEWQKSEQQRTEDMAYDVKAGEQEIALLKKGRESYLAQKEAKRQEALENETWWEKLGRWSGNNYDTSIPLAGASQYVGADGYTTPYDERIAELEARIQRAKDVQQYENQYAFFNSYTEMPDFDTKSAYKTTYRGGEKKENRMGALGGVYSYYTDTGFDDIIYDYINGNETAIERMNYNDMVDNDIFYGLDTGYLQEMTDDEIKIYNYLYEPGHPEAANQYLQFLLSDLTYRHRKTEQAYWSAYAQEHPFLASGFSIVTSPLKGLSAIGQVADYAADGTIDQNAGYNKFSYIPTAIRNQVSTEIEKSGKWGKVGSWTYQLGMSMGDFLMTTAVSGGNSTISLALMGSGAMADTVISAKDRGLSDEQALTLGVVAGGAEIITEKFSLDALFKGGFEKGAVKYILTNAFTEGTEEVSSSLINLFADVIVSKDKSQWQMEINAYLEEHPDATESEAFNKVLGDTVLSLGLDFLGGSLMGGVMGSGGATINSTANYVSEARTGRTIMGSETGVNNLLGLGAEVSSVAPAETQEIITKQSNAVSKKIDAGSNSIGTARKVGRLYNTVKKANNSNNASQNQADIAKSLKRDGFDSETADALAEALVAQAYGTDLSDSQSKLLRKHKDNASVKDALHNIVLNKKSTMGQRSQNIRDFEHSVDVGIVKKAIKSNYKSLEDRVGKDGRFGVSESGKTVIRGTEEEIDINKLDVATVGDSQLTFKVAEDREVSAGDIDFADADMSYLVSGVSDIENITPDAASVAIHSYDPSSKQTVGEYLNGFDEAFTYGLYGYSESDLKSGYFTKNLTSEQMMSAYELGKAARKRKGDIKEEQFKAMRTAAQAEAEKAAAEGNEAPKAKNLTITYNKGNGEVVSMDEAFKEGELDEKRSGAVGVAKILHKMGLGTKIEFFSSYISKTLKVKNKDGKMVAARVFLDADGNEKIAYSGVYRKSDGTIRVDLNAYNGRGLTLNALAHELTHFIQQWSTKKYKVLVDFLMKEYENTDLSMHERVLLEQKRLTDIRGKEVSYDEAYDEVVANSMMKMFDDGNMVEKLAKLKEQDTILAQKLWEGFKKILSKFLEFYNGNTGLRDADELVQMKDTFDKLQSMFAEALVEASENYQASLTPGVEGTVVSKTGEAVAHATEEGTVQLSMHTYETEGRDVFRNYLEKCVSSKKLTKAEMTEMLDGIDEIYQVCKEFKDKYAPFGTWSDAAVIRDTHGRPVFSVVTPNGDYKMNLDFSLVCKKRRTLDAVFNEMSKRGIIDDFELGQKSVVKINEIIRKYGLETACALCFVDAKRFRQASMADSFTRLYNELVESLVPEDQKSSISHFNFSGYDTIKKVENGIDTWDNSKLDFSHINHVLKTYGSKSVEYKTAKYIKTHAEGRKLLLRGDFMSSNGFDAVKTQNPDVLKLYNSKKGTGGPKAAFGDVQYMNEIIQKARWWTPEKAYAVGGVRIQSFSDYVPRMVFDYVQMIYDLAATDLPAHAYTKESLFVKQFGLTGIKINMSLIPAIAEGGIAPGLDENGNYVWAGESFDYETAKDIQNAEGYTENCGTICVGVSKEHILKLLRDPNIRMVIPYHKSGLNPIVAHMNKIADFHDYTNDQRTKGKDGKALDKDFDFNKALHDMGENANPKSVADQYLKWCAAHGYTPRFAEFAMEENYYKLLEDFTLYDKDGKYVPQRAVKAVFPTNDSAFGSMRSLIEAGLQEDAVIEGKRDKNLSAIVDEIQKTIPKTEAEIEETQVEQADRDLEQYSPHDVDFTKDFDYSDLNWAFDLGIITGKDSAIFERTINNEIFRGVKPISANGEYIIDTGKCLMFTDGDFHNPTLSRVIVFETEYESVTDNAKRRIIDEAEATGEVQVSISTIKSLFGERFVSDYIRPNGQTYARQNRGRKGANGKGANQVYRAKSLKERLAEEKDRDYFDALNRGDMDTVEKMVNKSAEDAGYEVTMFHETDADNIHIFDISRGTHGGTDYQTPYGIFTKTSEKNIGLGSKQMKLFVRAHNTLRVENREDVVNKIPGFAKYYDQIQAIDKKYDAISQQLEDEEFDALGEWIEANPDADMDVVYPTHYIADGKPADIDSARYQEAHRKYQENHAEWEEAYNAVAVKAKEFITNYLRSNNYDSMYFVIDGGSRGRQTDSLIVLDENQVKSADHVTYDDNGNVIPISQRFDQKKDDIRYSEHDTDYSNRSLLANAFEGITKSSSEYKLVQEYKGRIRILNEQEEKLSKLNAEIHKVRFTKGEYDAKKLKELEAEAKNVAESINRQDRKLLSLEASEPLRKLIEQERKKEALKTIDHVKEIVQNKKQRAEQTELRHKIRKAVRDLDKILNRGNKKRNVKQDMKGFVSKALELADYLFTDHISNDELIRKGITVRMTPRETALVNETEDILSQLYDNADNLTDEEFTRLDEKRKANEDKLRDLLTAQRNERLSTPVYNLFNDLVTEYANLKNSKQEAVKAAYDPNVERFLRSYIGESDGETDSDRKTLLQNMRVADMTTDELWKLHNAYKMVLHSVRNANALWVKGKTETIEQMAGRIMGDFSKRKIPDGKVATVIRNLSNKIGWDYEKLYYALDRIGSEAFTELVMNIANSENIVWQDAIEAAAFRDEIVKKYGFNNWDVNKKIDREFLDNTGKKFKLTLGELMSLYAYSRRKGAWDHIEYGGFVFGEKALTNPRPADSYKLSKEQVEAITSLLTDNQKAYVEAMQKFLSETMGAKGNEVSMQLYGIEMFTEKNYFPIHIAGQYKAQAQESQAKAAAGFGTMSNAGFTHAQNPNAKAPFVLEGFNEIWADHVNEMSRYHGTVPALEDMRRVMNRSSYSESGMESMAIKQLMENSFGKEAVEYFDNLYREANSGAITDKLQKKSHKLLNLFRKNSVAYSLSVLIQQPASVVRAYAMIDRKYFGVKGVGTITSGVVKAVSDKWTKAHTNAYNEMLKYAPGVTMAKEIGGFDTHTGGSIRRYLLDTSKSLKQKWKTGTVAEKGKAVLDLVDDNAIANLPNLADKIAWIEIWNACKRETVAKHKDLATNSEEFLQIVGDRFTEVIRATQVYDSIFAKSPMLKSKNLAVQYLVSFMNEPNTVANMAEKAVRDISKGNWKSGSTTAVVVIHSIIFTSLLKSIIYAMRDDDEDETYTEKYIEALTGSLMDDFWALNYIPLARDAWSIAQGYDVERADMAIVADFLDSIGSVIKNAATDTDDMTEEQLAEFEKKVTEANWKLVESMASFFGIPVKNVRREVEGVLDHARIAHANAGKTTPLSAWNKVRDAVIDSIPFMSAKVSKQDKLYEAIVAGDKVYVDRLKAGYKDEDAYNAAVRKALRENDPRIRAAAQAYYDGNLEEYKRIFKEIRNEDKHNLIGFDNIMEAVMSEVSSIKSETEPKTESSDYSATDFVNAVMVGDTDLADTMKEDIISYKVANGATREEAEEAFASSVSTSTRNAFDSGLMGEAEAEKMIMEYTGMDKEEAASKVDYWSFIKEHPQYRGVLTQSNVEKYHEFAEPAEIPLDVFVQYINSTKGIETKYDKWGDVELSVREQVLDAIDSLPISWQQKDALYLAHGYAESKIWDVPW